MNKKNTFCALKVACLSSSIRRASSSAAAYDTEMFLKKKTKSKTKQKKYFCSCFSFSFCFFNFFTMQNHSIVIPSSLTIQTSIKKQTKTKTKKQTKKKVFLTANNARVAACISLATTRDVKNTSLCALPTTYARRRRCVTIAANLNRLK